jgi:hypothetical protein
MAAFQMLALCVRVQWLLLKERIILRQSDSLEWRWLGREYAVGLRMRTYLENQMYIFPMRIWRSFSTDAFGTVARNAVTSQKQIRFFGRLK